MLGRAAGCGERGDDVRRRALELLDDSAAADDAVGVVRDLAAEEDEAPGRRDDGVRVADRARQRLRVDDAVRGRQVSSRIGSAVEVGP